MLEKLELEETQLKQVIKDKKQEIKDKTKSLQLELKNSETELKTVSKKIKDEKRKLVLDKSIHPMERFITWMNSKDKEKSDWIIKRGPLRDTFFDDEHRYETIYLEDRLWDVFYEIGYYISELDDEAEMNLDELDECVKKFDSWDKKAQDKLVEIIDDAINQNVSEYKQDW